MKKTITVQVEREVPCCDVCERTLDIRVGIGEFKAIGMRSDRSNEALLACPQAFELCDACALETVTWLQTKKGRAP